MANDILTIKNLSVSFQAYGGLFTFDTLAPIKDLSLSVKRGEITVVVGSSGSGKSLVAHAVMGILPENSKVGGTITYNGRPMNEETRKSIRKGEIVLIPQSIDYLDPLMPIGKQIGSLVREGDPRKAVMEILKKYDLPPETAKKYPFELSGGMARRVLISCGVVQKPQLIIADEPTPGLDEDLVEETIQHLLHLKQEGVSILIITHDLHVATRLADRIIFFNDGQSVCEVERSQFIGNPTFAGIHPFAQQLFSALPQNDFIDIGAAPAVFTNEDVLEAEHVSFAYEKDHPILKDVHFRVTGGEIVGLSGKSGRGKTTLSRILSGYLKPDSGAILLNGKPLYPRKRSYNPVQLIFQHPEKSVDFKWYMKDIINEPMPAESEVKKALGIREDWMDRYPQELSGGELQRFSITRSLHKETRFLICDEITTMFDTYTQAHVWKAVVEYARAHQIGMIIISHEPSLLSRLCDRIVTF